MYQEIPPSTKHKQNSLVWHTEKESIYEFETNSAFIDNNTHLKCYSTLINNHTLHNNTALSLIITNNSDNKVCILKDTKISECKEIKGDSYRVN